MRKYYGLSIMPLQASTLYVPMFTACLWSPLGHARLVKIIWQVTTKTSRKHGNTKFTAIPIKHYSLEIKTIINDTVYVLRDSIPNGIHIKLPPF